MPLYDRQGESKNIEYKVALPDRSIKYTKTAVDMRLIEHWGSGIPRIIDAVREAGLREPEFLGGDTDLRINIYRQSAAEVCDTAVSVPDTVENVPDTAVSVPDTVENVPDTAERLTPVQNTVYQYVREKGHANTDEVSILLDVQPRRARKVLSDLANRGLLLRVGAARSTRYIPADATVPDEASEMTNTQDIGS